MQSSQVIELGDTILFITSPIWQVKSPICLLLGLCRIKITNYNICALLYYRIKPVSIIIKLFFKLILDVNQDNKITCNIFTFHLLLKITFQNIKENVCVTDFLHFHSVPVHLACMRLCRWRPFQMYRRPHLAPHHRVTRHTWAA